MSHADQLEAVHAVLPHRDPFLFVDRIVERDEKRVVTEWRAKEDAPFFRGHYPGNPILPGVLLCEMAAQSSAILFANDPREDNATPVLTKIAEARFKRMVRPGETLRCDVALDERVGPARYVDVKITCDGQTVLRAKLVVAVTGGQNAG
jgi:3-hydroxyacyl-[acyl-carrier-protein] dehydratase